MDNNLKLIFNQILLGHTPFSYKDSAVFIKHFSNLDLSLIDIYREEQFQYARSKGVPSLQDKLDSLIKDNLWSKDKDKEITNVKDFLVNLRHSRTKYTSKKDKNIVDKEIKIYEDRLFNLTIEKDNLIGKTSEQFADKKVNEYYLYLSLYKDSHLKEQFFSAENFDELDEFELTQLLLSYNKRMELFNHIIFKKIALSPAFSNLFYLCDDNIYSFYGRPVIDLSFYQIQIFSYAKGFKNTLQNSKVQPDVVTLNDPDKLLIWLDSAQNSDRLIGESSLQDTNDTKVLSDNVSLVGLDKQEIKDMGLEVTNDDKIKEALKNSKSGELGLEDLLKIEGYKMG